MSALCSNFQIPASNIVGGVRVTQTVLQCDIVKICISFRGHNSAIMYYFVSDVDTYVRTDKVKSISPLPTSWRGGGGH